MLRLHAYYFAKPFLPRRLKMALRRFRARRVLRHCGDVWPIDEEAAREPDGWPGWPDGKQFAVVLTHDVEGQRGVERVKQLAEVEMALGFRSSFNLIPEGDYSVLPALRDWLVDNGFEVGVHDLHHDGKLYRSRAGFRRNAAIINQYMEEWNAVGFRSAFMLHKLDWLHDLDMVYDASTFDTDPFEPQPDGVKTIFPFWVPFQGSESEPVKNTKRGYMELPYPLVQDYNLFVILQEKTIDIWTRKLAWIAERGGMALFNTHPDYMSFGGSAIGRDEFSIELYRKALQHIRSEYAGAYWHALPREVASFSAPAILPRYSGAGNQALVRN